MCVCVCACVCSLCGECAVRCAVSTTTPSPPDSMISRNSSTLPLLMSSITWRCDSSPGMFSMRRKGRRWPRGRALWPSIISRSNRSTKCIMSRIVLEGEGRGGEEWEEEGRGVGEGVERAGGGEEWEEEREKEGSGSRGKEGREWER